MKKSELIFNALLVPLDFIFIILSALVIYFLRSYEPVLKVYPILYSFEFERYVKIMPFIALFILIIYALEGLYSMKATRGPLKEFFKIFTATSVALMFFIIAAFVDRDIFSSRFVLIGGWALIIFLVSFERLLVRMTQRWLSKKGIGVHRLLIVGSNDISDKIVSFINTKSRTPYRIEARIRKATKENLLRFKNKIDGVVQCDPMLPVSQVNTLARFCEIYRIEFKYVPNLFAARATNIDIRSLAGFPVVEIKRTPLDGWGKVIKRTVDVLGSLFGLIVLSPFFIIIATAIKLDSKGPVFMRLSRISKGRKFKLIKFRSMVKGAQKKKKELMKFNERKDGPLFKMKDDPRVTKIGKFLRRTRLDEFPQLINVLKGNISLIGPRPHEPEEVKKYKFHHRKVLTIKAGMTGMAQISGSSNLSFEDEVGLDTYYVENWSLLLDFVILLKTAYIVVRGDRSAC